MVRLTVAHDMAESSTWRHREAAEEKDRPLASHGGTRTLVHEWDCKAHARREFLPFHVPRCDPELFVDGASM